MLCYITRLMLCHITYVIFVIYSMCHVIYITYLLCHVILCLLYNITCVMFCYITYVILCYNIRHVIV